MIVGDSSQVKRSYDASAEEIYDRVEGIQREKVLVYMMFATEQKVFVEDGVFEELMKELVFILKEA
jgi:hypothetical protein